MHRSCFSLLQMLLPMLLALSGSTVKAATQDQEWAQERANAVLSLMTFTVVPDITASNLDIGSGTNQSAALNMTQIGGGATMSEAVPIYLEGAIGFSRYDPQFVVSNGTESRTLPTKWNSLTASGGIGWDIALHEDPRGGHWVLRPIANVSLGTMASDLRIGNWLLERTKGYSLDFLDGGQLNMYGLGGVADARLRALFKDAGYRSRSALLLPAPAERWRYLDQRPWSRRGGEPRSLSAPPGPAIPLDTARQTGALCTGGGSYRISGGTAGVAWL